MGPGVVATWGGTSRAEISVASDLDVFWWNARDATPPSIIVRTAAYLDIIKFCGESVDLRAWATSNATDLAGVLFARDPRGDGTLVSEFEGIQDDLWSDLRIRALLLVHLVSGAALSPAAQPLARHAKFAEGATRSWTWLADSWCLYEGVRSRSTSAKLRAAVERGIFSSQVLGAWERAWMRRLAEEREGAVAAVPPSDLAIWRSAATRLLEAAREWLEEALSLPNGLLHTVIEALKIRETVPKFSALSGDLFPSRMLSWMWGEPPDACELGSALLGQDAWWVANAVLANPATKAEAIIAILQHVRDDCELWRDRNLILYSIRHTAAEERIARLIGAFEPNLRSIDRQDLAKLYHRLEIEKRRPSS